MPTAARVRAGSFNRRPAAAACGLGPRSRSWSHPRSWPGTSAPTAIQRILADRTKTPRKIPGSSSRLEPTGVAGLDRIFPIDGGDHAPRRQVELHRQTKAASRTHRGRLRGPRRPDKEAERRAWATVNKETHGGKKSGSGRGTKEDHSPSKKGGRLGGAASAKRPAAERSRSAQKADRARVRCRATTDADHQISWTTVSRRLPRLQHFEGRRAGLSTPCLGRAQRDLLATFSGLNSANSMPFSAEVSSVARASLLSAQREQASRYLRSPSSKGRQIAASVRLCSSSMRSWEYSMNGQKASTSIFRRWWMRANFSLSK